MVATMRLGELPLFVSKDPLFELKTEGPENTGVHLKFRMLLHIGLLFVLIKSIKRYILLFPRLECLSISSISFNLSERKSYPILRENQV